MSKKFKLKVGVDIPIKLDSCDIRILILNWKKGE